MRFLDAHLLPSKTERASEEESFPGGGEEEEKRRRRRYFAEMHDPALGGNPAE